MADVFTSTRFEHSDDCAANALWVNQYRAALAVSRDTRERYATEVAEAEVRAAASDALAREQAKKIAALELLTEGQEKLLVAYRLGAGPQTARTAIKGADMVREAKDRLALLARGADGDGDV